MKPLMLNWLVPEPFPGAGGDTGLFRITRYLTEFGHDCCVYVVPYRLMKGYSTAQIRRYIHEHFGATGAVYHKWEGAVRDADATFATFWPTAEDVLALPNGGRRYYLVQDFEPSFYPDEPHHYERAEATYRAGFHCITLGPWLTKLLREKYHAQADYFDFAVDTDTYYPRAKNKSARGKVCFYARPATPRRAYELGLAALSLVRAQLPEAEIVFFGANKLEPEPPFPVTNLGILSPQDLAELFSSCDVGIVFSLTNPSFVPFEMMACRCALVELESERWMGQLRHKENAWLAEPTPASIANGVISLMTNNSLCLHITEQGYSFVRTKSWRESIRQIETILLRDIPESARVRATKS